MLSLGVSASDKKGLGFNNSNDHAYTSSKTFFVSDTMKEKVSDVEVPRNQVRQKVLAEKPIPFWPFST